MTPAEHLAEALSGQGGAALGVAVSGGGDSMALLYLAADWAGRAKAQLRVATVDHGLRTGLDAEHAIVANAAGDLGLAHTILRVPPLAPGNVQHAARHARYEALADWARAEGCAAVLLGHTENDLAETLLMRLARGSGLDGLSAMEPDFVRQDMRFLRPLLGVGRAALRAELRQRGVSWCEDPSNEDTSFQRVRARQALEALAPLGLKAAALADTANRLRTTRQALDDALNYFAERCVAQAADGSVRIDLAGFEALGAHLRARILGEVLRGLTGGDYAPRRVQIEAVLAQLKAEGDVATLAHHRIARDAHSLHFTREFKGLPAPQPLTSGQIWDARWHIEGVTDRAIMPLGESGLSRMDWRTTGLSRRALIASPAVDAGEEPPQSLVLEPPTGLTATLVPLLPLVSAR
ncbi:MAG: tRNA lysidine(34) synthetase TilS [Pseudomonadota bacterium]